MPVNAFTTSFGGKDFHVKNILPEPVADVTPPRVYSAYREEYLDKSDITVKKAQDPDLTPTRIAGTVRIQKDDSYYTPGS
jgi:hypothetical protein